MMEYQYNRKKKKVVNHNRMLKQMQYLRSSERFVYDKFIRSATLEFVCFRWVFLKRAQKT